jgi:hypothetical protein
VNPCNEALEVVATDVPGAGSANHRYEISGFDGSGNPSVKDCEQATGNVIVFQNGPILEAGVNGVTQEVLLAVVIDRLRCFQAGPYSCRENALALTKCEEALMWLNKRTRDCELRGVEGTSAK